MNRTFRDALVWHMDRDKTKIADLVRVTGVSRDVINKLMARPDSSTTTENAMLIAAYYGKSVNQFMSLQEVSPTDQLNTLIGLLEPAELRIVTAQILGLVGNRIGR